MSHNAAVHGLRLSFAVAVAMVAAGCLGGAPDESSPEEDLQSALSGACANAPAWSEGVQYAIGDLVQYKGEVYRCTLPHGALSSWTPDVVPALWKEETECSGGGAPSPSAPSPGGGDPGAGSPSTGAQYSGTASYHAEYETGVTGFQVACAPNAFSVPDWDTRFDPARLGYMVTALQATVYDGLGKEFVCNECVRVTAQRTGRTVTVRVIDRMTHAGTDNGKTRFLDLSPRAFQALGGTEAEGVIPIDFSFVDCPGNLQ